MVCVLSDGPPLVSGMIRSNSWIEPRIAKNTESRMVEPSSGSVTRAEDLPAGGAVDVRGLVEVRIDLLQAGDVEHHVEAEVLPHHDDEDGVHGEIAARRAR